MDITIKQGGTKVYQLPALDLREIHLRFIAINLSILKRIDNGHHYQSYCSITVAVNSTPAVGGNRM